MIWKWWEQPKVQNMKMSSRMLQSNEALQPGVSRIWSCHVAQSIPLHPLAYSITMFHSFSNFWGLHSSCSNNAFIPAYRPKTSNWFNFSDIKMTFALQVGELYFIWLVSIHPNCHKITAEISWWTYSNHLPRSCPNLRFAEKVQKYGTPTTMNGWS